MYGPGAQHRAVGSHPLVQRGLFQVSSLQSCSPTPSAPALKGSLATSPRGACSAGDVCVPMKHLLPKHVAGVGG